MLVLDLRQSLPQQGPEARHPLQETRRQNNIQHRGADACRQRIAAKCRAMRANRHALGGFLGREASPDRKAAAKPLGQRHDVGRHARVLYRKKAASSPDARLHLVEHQQQPAVIA